MMLYLLVLVILSVRAETNFYDLEVEQQQDWIRSFNNFKTQNHELFEQFVAIHVNNFDTVHLSENTELFFSFHEIYMNLFKNISLLELYYWNFEEVPIQKYVKDFGGFGVFCSNSICYQRQFRTSSLRIDKNKNNDMLFLKDEIHNKIHQFIGGTFISPYSPRDILFYPFHVYINMLYKRSNDINVSLVYNTLSTDTAFQDLIVKEIPSTN